MYPSPCRECVSLCSVGLPPPQSAVGAVAIGLATGLSWDCDLTTLQLSVLGGQADVSAEGP